jgi:galactokinase
MPDVARADAPGRVNVIGEHTDYHEGYVLPAAIALRTRVGLRKRSDGLVRAASTAYLGSSAEYRLGHEGADGSWADYVKSTTFALARRGAELTGFEVQIDSDVPVGAGLSSSAALLVALLRGLRTLFNLRLTDLEIARVAQGAETDFVGAPVGIMDQMACSLGQVGAALFIDTRTLDVEVVALPIGLELAVIDSGVAHRHADGGYATRRDESFAAAAALGVSHLRDAGSDVLERLATIPPLLRKRASHIVAENARVLEAVEALRSNDPATLGRLFNASHRSLRNDYDVSTPDVDTLVEVAQRDPAVFGARMTGGGFGGAVIVAIEPGTEAAQRVTAEYVRLTGRPGELITTLSARPTFGKSGSRRLKD